MSESRSRVLHVLYLVAVTLLVLINVVPLAGEYLFTMHGWKSYFLDFNLLDQEGKRHSGLVGLGTIPLRDGEILQYGYEAGPERAGPERKRSVLGAPDADGFHWADRGFLWCGYLKYFPARQYVVDGKRIGRKIEPWQQGELSGPGAPWDVQGPTISFLGNYPEYVVAWENPSFKFDLTYRSRASSWYHWNGGETFTTGDFGHGNMSELPCNVTGTILHKADNTVHNVSGWGVMEDAVGNPWNWFEWGNHNWFSCDFGNGWALGFWLAPDDWQWGYNVSPHEVWVYDSTNHRFYHGKRVEFLEYEWGHDPINGIKYPLKYAIRAVTDAGVLEMRARSVSYTPILVDVKYLPVDIKLTYSAAAMDGGFTYFDGSSVELKNGMGTMEYYPRYTPNMITITPWSLALLALLIGGRSIRTNRGDPRKAKRAVWAIIASWLAIGLLTLKWL